MQSPLRADGDSEKPLLDQNEGGLPSLVERWLDWFQQNGAQLKAWEAESGTHAQLLLSDPLKSIREAGLAIPDDLIPELQRTAKAIRG